MQTPITGRNTLPVAQKPIHTYIHKNGLGNENKKSKSSSRYVNISFHAYNFSMLLNEVRFLSQTNKNSYF